MLYFAYGSNLNHHQMKNIRCPGSAYIKNAFLMNYQLSFCHPNKNNVFGYANVHKKGGAKVPGAIWQINNTPYGLSAALYSSDINFAMRAFQEIETGLVYVNASCIGAEVHLPFGGLKGTGNGHRDAGQTMLDNCTEWKVCSVDFSGRIQKAQIDP